METEQETRQSLTRGHGFSEEEALQAAGVWLLAGYAVRAVRDGQGTLTLETWWV